MEEFVHDRMAVIDIGSGSMKVSVFEKVGEKIKSVSEIVRGFRLCQKIGASISEKKIGITMGFFSNALSLARSHRAKKIVAVATQAARRAPNFLTLQRKIFEKFAIDLHAISGTKEATLVANGVHMATGMNKFISFDVGCGSMEIVKFDGVVRDVWSLSISAIDLSQTGDFAKAESFIANAFVPLPLSACEISECSLVGIGGTLRVASLLINGKMGNSLGYVELKSLFHTLEHMTEKERVEFGVSKARVDIFPFGLLVVLKLMESLGAEKLFLSNVTLRMSLALDFFSTLK
ncbi:MAG: hypothetical protein LBI61_00495 [Puniceicoccales bacterium]|jgi:exopolyphosphatase/guanosine-5'-triphosphate,3'-diphosphate pyrophosphatase|nr:hypothetical protein [Puniceicoccales bacterium]